MKFKLMYDDNELDIMDKVNACLESKGLEFRDDGLEHDGWMEYELVEIEKDTSSRSSIG